MKPRKLLPLFIAVVALSLPAFGASSSAETQAKKRDGIATEPGKTAGTRPNLPPIREFDLEMLSRLGREIYQHDQLAWVATDKVFAQVSEATIRADGGCGWVVDTSGAEPLVRFVRRSGPGASEEAAYDVLFPKGDKPVVAVPKDRTLTPHQVRVRAALASALAPFAKGEYPLCKVARGGYNFVVLDDPVEDGFLVYLLRPKDTMDSVPVGGHYRVSVSADGKTVKQVDRLSASCLTLNKGAAKTPTDGKIVALSMNHVVSNTPVETHVFVSLQDKLPLFVVTPDGRMWDVENGKITAAGNGASPPRT